MADSAPAEDRLETGSVTAAETKEDAETRAARRELKQSSISDPASNPDKPSAAAADDDGSRPVTPAVEEKKEEQAVEEQILSPKKKRAHDQLDSDKPAPADDDAKSNASTDSAKDRARRLEPEKKRARDGGESTAKESDDPATEAAPETKPADATKASEAEVPQTKPSAFAASGFGKLATSSSPFASLGGSGSSGFGSAGAKPLTSFASPSKPAEPAAAPKFSFGGASGASPFAGLASSTNGFGSALGSGTGSPFGTPATGLKPLGSFAAPNTKPLTSEKPAKPFGAPDSDVESEDDDDNDDEEGNKADDERAASPEKDSDDKKKPKLQKVEVDSGEAGEATLVSVRAKVFHHDKDAGWKERGSGMLKINAPVACVEFDDAGVPIPGSFDASGLEADEDEEAGEGAKGPGTVRLILRQDQTHRVILNTAVLAATKFQEKASLKSVGIIFTAFEGEDAKPVAITVKMSVSNAKIFMDEISMIQRELQSS